jgi:hypothetical protein
VHGEQGLGDAVQFARFVPQLKARVARLVLLLDGYWAPLAPLLASLAGVDRVVVDAAGLGRESPLARASLLSLPHLAHAELGTLPQPPYLAAPADRRDAWRARLAPLASPRIGLAWSVFARDDHGYVTRQKSVPPEALAPILDVPGVAFVSLQPGAAGRTAALGERASRVAPTGEALEDFGDTAALIDAVDLVVTPDTAVAHVAGALGKPVWLLERFHGCWRWRASEERSPWYPTLRIFRQRRFGDWSTPVANAALALAAWRDARR